MLLQYVCIIKSLPRFFVKTLSNQSINQSIDSFSNKDYINWNIFKTEGKGKRYHIHQSFYQWLGGGGDWWGCFINQTKTNTISYNLSKPMTLYFYYSPKVTQDVYLYSVICRYSIIHGLPLGHKVVHGALKVILFLKTSIFKKPLHQEQILTKLSFTKL